MPTASRPCRSAAMPTRPRRVGGPPVRQRGQRCLAVLVEGQDLQLDGEVDLAHVDAVRHGSTHGAKFRMLVTPAATSRSATSCAACAGVAITAMEMRLLGDDLGRSSMWRTTRPLICSPTRAGSASKSAAMRKPRLAKPA